MQLIECSKLVPSARVSEKLQSDNKQVTFWKRLYCRNGEPFAVAWVYLAPRVIGVTCALAEKHTSYHIIESLRQLKIAHADISIQAQLSDAKTRKLLRMPLQELTDDTRLLTQAAILGLGLIFKPGYQYKKAGIMLTLISDKTKRQQTLFDDPLQRAQSANLMAAMDAINAQFGRDTVTTGANGTEKRWAMRSENRSPRFTTQWDELPIAK